MILGDREHDKGDHEQDQAKRDQRRGIEIANRLGELVGDARRNRCSWREQRRRYLVRVADDEGHGHRFSKGASKSEHDAADDPNSGVGNDDVPDHLPGRAADSVGRFLQHRRHGVEHVARNRRDEGQNHDRQHKRGGQYPDSRNGALRTKANCTGTLAKSADDERLHVCLDNWPEIINAPDAVNDRGIPANSSMAMPIGRRRGGQQSSVRKTATPRPRGTAITIAMTEVTTVP